MNWGAFFTIFVIVIVAGGIAFIGDRVGHQVGRRRMTLFGLRPKYTSTIFAVGFGMLIALLVIVVSLIASYDARQALFNLARLNDQIANLTRERDRLLEDPVMFRAGEALTSPVIISSKNSADQIQQILSVLFVEVADRYRNVAGIRPYPKDPLSPQVKASIAEAAKGIKALDPTPAIVLPVAGQNIFRDTAMSISFAVYKDVLIYRAGETMVSVAVPNGKDINGAQAALIQLQASLEKNAEDHGMPESVADDPAYTMGEAEAGLRQLTSINGPALVRGVAPVDIYAHGPLETRLVVTRVAGR